MKWLPPPSVPSCASGSFTLTRGCFSVIFSSRSARGRHRDVTDAGETNQLPRTARPLVLTIPCGTARSIAARTFASESGRSLAVSVVCTAIMPQPMSTPTAAGMIAPFVGDHRAHGRAPAEVHVGHCGRRGRTTNGMRATFSSWRFASSSTGTPRVHIFTCRPPGTLSTS